MAKSKRWSIDVGDRKSLSEVRHDAIRELASVTRSAEEQFAAEILIGEILIEEASVHPQAAALEIVHDKAGSTLHVYSQVDESDKSAIAALQQNLASKCGLPLRMYASPQGLHIEVTFGARRDERKQRLRTLWDVACCVLAERTQKILRRRLPDGSLKATADADLAPSPGTRTDRR